MAAPPNLEIDDLVNLQYMQPGYLNPKDRDQIRQKEASVKAIKVAHKVGENPNPYDLVAAKNMMIKQQNRTDSVAEGSIAPSGKSASSSMCGSGGGGYARPAGRGASGGFAAAALIPFAIPIIQQGIQAISKLIKKKRGRGVNALDITEESLTDNFGDIFDEIEQKISTSGSGASFWKNVLSGVKKGITTVLPTVLDIGAPLAASMADQFIQAKFGKGSGIFGGKAIFDAVISDKIGGGFTGAKKLKYGNIMEPILMGAINKGFAKILNVKGRGVMMDILSNEASDILDEPVFGGAKRGRFLSKLKEKGKAALSKLSKSAIAKQVFAKAKDVGSAALESGVQTAITKGLDKITSLPVIRDKPGAIAAIQRGAPAIREAASAQVRKSVAKIGETPEDLFAKMPSRKGKPAIEAATEDVDFDELETLRRESLGRIGSGRQKKKSQGGQTGQWRTQLIQ